MLVGIIGTAIAAFTIDRVGRRGTLYWGAVALSIVLFAIGGLFRGAIDNPDKATQYGTAAAAMVFVYLLIFSSSWLLIPFIYPTEIFPTWLRAKGNAFGVAGWAVGYGGGSLLVPVMFSGINEKVRSLQHHRQHSRLLTRLADFLCFRSVSGLSLGQYRQLTILLVLCLRISLSYTAFSLKPPAARWKRSTIYLLVRVRLPGKRKKSLQDVPRCCRKG